MSDHKRVFGKTFAELDAQAKEAARRAVADLHAKGIPTYHMEGGKIIQTAPDGTRRELDAPPADRQAKARTVERDNSSGLSF
jgi:hypothetical protein